MNAASTKATDGGGGGGGGFLREASLEWGPGGEGGGGGGLQDVLTLSGVVHHCQAWIWDTCSHNEDEQAV